MAGSTRPWTCYRASTPFLRIPRVDWPKVIAGEKTELRAAGRNALNADRLNPPIPVVGYTMWEHKPPTSRLLVLEQAHTEPLGAISPEALAREGFATIKEFKHYWRLYRTREAYKPLTKVWVYRIRPFTPDDVDEFGRRLFDHIYGEHAPR